MKATVSRRFASDQRLAALLFVLAASVASTAVIANPERPRFVAVASNGPTGSALIPVSIDDVISHYLADRIEPSTSRGTRVAAVESLPAALLKAKSDVLSAKYDGIATLHLAQTFRGVPYRFGGATPRAFDCSGYTQYVFGQLGYNLPHFAQSQYNWASPVPREKAGPGDFVFIHQPGGYVYHVGIYAGNGMMWHAPKPGGSVELSALFGNVTFGTVPQAKVDERFVAKVRILEAALAISKRHFPV